MIDFLSMVDGKAFLYMTFCTGAIYSFRKIKKALASDTEQGQPHTLDSRTKLLIDELHELKQQHTNISQFVFDYEQEKESIYSINYTDALNIRHTADIIKASDKDEYLKRSAEQQIIKIESRIEEILQELSSVYAHKQNTFRTMPNIIKRTKKASSGDSLKELD